MVNFFSDNSNTSNNQNSLSPTSLCRNIDGILPDVIKALEGTQGLLGKVINYYSNDNSPTLAS